MRGRYLERRWTYDPAAYAPPRYRKACAYEAFLPDPVGTFNKPVAGELAGVVSDAEAAARSLNERARPGLRALARLQTSRQLIEPGRRKSRRVIAIGR